MNPCTRDRIIAAVAILALALGLIMAFFCDAGFLKVVGVVIAIISTIVFIDYSAESL